MIRSDHVDRAALLLAKKLKHRKQEAQKREDRFDQEARECLNRILAKIASAALHAGAQLPEKGGRP
jgi:hypothetical protein